MSQITYLHPEIVDGRASGRFRLVQVDPADGSEQKSPEKASRGAIGLAIAFLLSAILWAAIVAFLF